MALSHQDRFSIRKIFRQFLCFQDLFAEKRHHHATYNELMKNGWSMKEIDEMDMLDLLRLRAWDTRRKHEKKKPRQRFMDEVWPGVKPGT